MAIVAENFVVHGVFACVCRRGDFRRPNAVDSEFILHCAAVNHACRNQIKRIACVNKVCNSRRFSCKYGFCTSDLKLRRLFRAVVVRRCDNLCFDKVTTGRCRNGFDKRPVGSRAISERRRAEQCRCNGHFGFFAVCPTFQRQSRDLVRCLGNSELQSNLSCIIAVRRYPLVICFIGQFQYNVVFSYIRTAFVGNNLVAIVLRYYRGQFTARVDLRSNGRSFQLCFWLIYLACGKRGTHSRQCKEDSQHTENLFHIISSSYFSALSGVLQCVISVMFLLIYHKKSKCIKEH